MTKIYICDDHKLVVEGMQLMLGEEPDIQVTGCCYSGEALIEEIKAKNIYFDILLLDINLPGINGIEVCKIVRQMAPDLKIIALTMLRELSLVKLMIKTGANGYLLKNAGREEILKAIQTVSVGKKYIDEEVKDLLLDDLSNGKPRRSLDIIPSLSRREKEVLALILEECTANEIAEKLFIGLGTVETHRRNILSKLGARNTAGMVRMAIEYNLLKKE